MGQGRGLAQVRKKEGLIMLAIVNRDGVLQANERERSNSTEKA